MRGKRCGSVSRMVHHVSPLSIELGENPRETVMWADGIAAESKSEYATSEDFRKLFTENLNSLYLLSFLLTANHKKAEQCFVAGLDDCVDGDPVFHNWAYSWARRIIIHNAACMMAPCADPQKSAPGATYPAGDNGFARVSEQDAPFARVLALGDLERFVFVLSTFEKYSDQECSAVVGTSLQNIQETRARALQHIPDPDGSSTKRGKDSA
jgi:hypothetical protein